MQQLLHAMPNIAKIVTGQIEKKTGHDLDGDGRVGGGHSRFVAK